MAVSESMRAEFKMGAIIKLSKNEWVKFFVQRVWTNLGQVWVSLKGNTEIAESKMARSKRVEFKMAAIMKLGENEWVGGQLN